MWLRSGDAQYTHGATPGITSGARQGYREPASIDPADVALEVIGFGARHRGGMVGRSATDFENLQPPSRAEGRFRQHILEHRALDVAGATACDEDAVVSQRLDRQAIE